MKIRGRSQTRVDACVFAAPFIGTPAPAPTPLFSRSCYSLVTRCVRVCVCVRARANNFGIFLSYSITRKRVLSLRGTTGTGFDGNRSQTIRSTMLALIYSSKNSHSPFASRSDATIQLPLCEPLVTISWRACERFRERKQTGRCSLSLSLSFSLSPGEVRVYVGETKENLSFESV